MKKTYPSNIALCPIRVKAFCEIYQKGKESLALLTNGQVGGIINGNLSAAVSGRMERFMKKIILVIACLICAVLMCSCNRAVTKDILDADGNAVATGHYEGDRLVYEEKADDRGDVVEKTEYDESGRAFKVTKFRNGTIAYEDEYAYGDSEGNYTLTAIVYNVKGEASNKTVITYENAIPVKEVAGLSENEDEKLVTTYKYNEDGTVLKEITSAGVKVREVLDDGNGVIIYDHEVNSDGAATRTYYIAGEDIEKIESYNKEGKLVYSMAYEYNDDGKVKKTVTTNANGDVKDYSEYTYVDGKLAAIHKYNANKTINSTVTYDENGKATVHKGQYIGVNKNENKTEDTTEETT